MIQCTLEHAYYKESIGDFLLKRTRSDLFNVIVVNRVSCYLQVDSNRSVLYTIQRRFNYANQARFSGAMFYS